jgi:hypothetical protein
MSINIIWIGGIRHYQICKLLNVIFLLHRSCVLEVLCRRGILGIDLLWVEKRQKYGVKSFDHG